MHVCVLTPLVVVRRHIDVSDDADAKLIHGAAELNYGTYDEATEVVYGSYDEPTGEVVFFIG